MYSVNKELIVRSNSDTVDFALLKDGKLIELHQEREESEDDGFQVGLHLAIGACVFSPRHKYGLL